MLPITKYLSSMWAAIIDDILTIIYVTRGKYFKLSFKICPGLWSLYKLVEIWSPFKVINKHQNEYVVFITDLCVSCILDRGVKAGYLILSDSRLGLPPATGILQWCCYDFCWSPVWDMCIWITQYSQTKAFPIILRAVHGLFSGWLQNSLLPM